MSEFRIGARARAQQSAEAPLPSRRRGDTPSFELPASLTPSTRDEAVGPSGLGVIGRLALSEGVASGTGPYTLDSAVEELERQVLDILDEADPAPNPNLPAQIAAGITHPIGSDAHIEAARSGEAAWLPLPQSLNRMLSWERNEYDHGIRDLARAFEDINYEIEAYIRENDLSDDQIRSLLRSIIAPKSNALFGDGDDFEEDVIRQQPGHETFGAFYTILMNKDHNNRGGYGREIRQSMRSLFDRWGTGNIARTLAEGAIQVLDDEADRLGLTRHKDPDEQKQEISLAILNLIAEVGRDSYRWTVSEREQWSQFIEEVRHAALEHPQEALAALRERYGDAA